MYVQSVVTSGFELLIGASGLFTSLIGLLDCMLPSVVLTYTSTGRSQYRLQLERILIKAPYFVYLSS
jgi:hypothetical protein